MLCDSCGGQNKPNARFCRACGGVLARRCRECDAELEPDDRFCDQCGASVDPADASADAPAGPTPTPAVRKNVTALFADLVGSTVFGERVDPEAARTALAPYFDMLRATIEDHAGSIAKFTGDGALAVFGVPEVAEDDALRAVNAAVELQQRFSGFAAAVRQRHGVELGLRVGINSGELVIGDDDADLVGDVLNTAARLEAECTPGRVLVGEDTWRLTRAAMTYEVLGEVRVKGKSEPVATFQVVDATRARSDDVEAFVGRELELQTLVDAFTSVRDTPMARLVSVIGAPGVGKTRLAAELLDTTQATSFSLRLERRGTTTFSPVADLLRSLTDGTADGIARLLDGHDEHERLGPILQSFLGHTEARSTEESFWAVRRLLEHLSTVYGPIIVVVDDVQWAEPLFLDLLDHLVEWAEVPVLIVALARPELRDLRPELAQPGRRVAAAIALEGLDPSATRELASRLLGADELPAEFVDRIPDTTEGNPLFVRELVQMLVDDGTLARDGDRWRLTIDVDAVEVPPTILSLLASRVERLPGDERRLIELASVIGAEFDRGTLTAIAPIDIAAVLGALLDRLRRRDLIEPSGAWAGDQPVYRFHHVLVRDAAYRRVLKSRRAELHELVGRHLEPSGRSGVELDVTLAHHFEQVVRYRRELGTDDGTTADLAEIAIGRLQNAATEALDRDDLTAAGRYAMRALALADSAASSRDELLLLGCEALLSSGDAGAATPLVHELHERSTDARLAAWADCFRAQRWALTDPDRLTEAAELTADAAGRLATLRDDSGVAKARLVRAACLQRLGRVGECEAELDLALSAARAAGDRRRTVAVLGAAPLAALWGPSPVARAGGRCLDVLRLLRITTASPAVEATSVRCQGVLEALRGRFDSARVKLDAARTTARELGLRHGLYETELFAGFTELWAVDPVAAEHHLRIALDGLTRLGAGSDAGFAAAMLARALIRQDRPDEAAEFARQALDAAGQNLQTVMAGTAVLAEARAAQGDHAGAAALIERGLDLASDTDQMLDHALVLLTARRVARDAGDSGASAEYTQRAIAVLEAKGVTVNEQQIVQRGQSGPTDDDVTTTGSTVMSNAAWELHVRVDNAIRNDDLDELDRLHSEEFAPRFASRFDPRPTSRHEYFTFAIDSSKQHGHGDDELLAVRGDHLALIRNHHSRDGHHTTRYVLTRVRDGRCDLTIWYDGDQLDDALMALDEHWADGDDPIVALKREFTSVVSRGDRSAARALLTDDFVSVDHRPVGFGERDAETFLTSTLPDSDDPSRVFSSDYLRLAGDGAAGFDMARLTRLTGDNEGQWILIGAVRGGRIARLEQFALEDLDTAERRFDELAGARRSGPTNAAFELGGLSDALHRGDRDEIDHYFHPDLVVEHRRPEYGALRADRESRETFIARIMDDWRVDGMDRQWRHPLAVRGDHLYLARFTQHTDAGDQIVDYMVVEVEDEQLLAIVYFGVDQFDDALAELHRRWHARGGAPPMTDIELELMRASNAGDAARFRRLLADGFVAVDHRPLGFGQRSAAEFVESASNAPDTGQRVVISEYLGLTDDTSLARVTRFSDDDESTFLAIVQAPGGAIRRIETFASDDLDSARRRFDVLVGRSGAHTLNNHAAALVERMHHALHHQLDRDAMMSVFARDVEITFAETLDVRPADLDSHIDFAIDSIRERGALQRTLTAVRGDRLCIGTITRPGDPTRRHVVYRSTDTGIDRMHWYGDGQLAEALADLDAQWVESGGAVDPVVSRIGSAVCRGNLADVADCITEDGTVVDHRPFGLGTRDRDQYLESTRSVLGEVDLFVADYLEVDEHASLAHVVMRSRRGDDSWPIILVTEHDGERVRRMDQYPLEAMAEARSHYERLVGPRPATLGRGALHNTASRLGDEYVRAALDGDRDRMRALISDDAVYDNALPWHRAMAVDPRKGDDIVESTLALADHGWLGVDRDTFAIRGDRLALCRTTYRFRDGDTTSLLMHESDDDRLVRMTRFGEDELHDALDALDRRWAELDGSPSAKSYAEFLVEMRHAQRDGDLDRLRPLLAADFATVDHRPLGMGIRSRVDWLDTTQSRFDATGGVDWIPTSIDHCRGVYLTPIEVRSDDGDVWQLIFVGDHDGRHLLRCETFPPEMADAARARYDELLAP